jgi:hypothetical protein
MSVSGGNNRLVGFLERYELRTSICRERKKSCLCVLCFFYLEKYLNFTACRASEVCYLIKTYLNVVILS